MPNFAPLDEARSALTEALGKMTGKTGTDPTLAFLDQPHASSVVSGSVGGLQRQRRGAVAVSPPQPSGRGRTNSSGAVLGSPQLVQLKVQIEDCLRQVETYQALPVGQIAVLQSRTAALKSLLASLEAIVGNFQTHPSAADILKHIVTAYRATQEGYSRLDHLSTMYGAAAGDPGFHWRMISGLIGGYAPPSSGRQVWVQGLSPTRLLEYLNPQRTFDSGWNRQIDEWLKAVKADQTKEPFFLWFEANGKTMGGKGTTYMDEGMRAAALVTLRDGQLWRLQAQDQGPAVETPFTTSVFNKDKTEEYDMFMAYCLDEYGVLYVYPHNEAAGIGLTGLAREAMAQTGCVSSGAMHDALLFHSSGHRGEPVAGAGMIRTYQGKVVSITTKSGHYWPTLEMFVQTLAYLESALDNALAHFAFNSSGDLISCCTKATEFLRLARMGFPPKETSELLMFGDMNMKSGEVDSEGFYSGEQHLACLQDFLESYSRFGQSETRRIVEEQRIAHRTRLEIYRGRTLDPVLARKFEQTVMEKVIRKGESYLGPTPFDEMPLDSRAAQNHGDRIDALEQGQGRGRARANGLLRFQPRK